MAGGDPFKSVVPDDAIPSSEADLSKIDTSVEFLDIGTGIPSANNTHEVAQRVAPDTRVVYTDNDPIEASRRYNQNVATRQTLRSHADIARFFDGLEVLEPGLVQWHLWRPDPEDAAPPSSSRAIAAWPASPDV